MSKLVRIMGFPNYCVSDAGEVFSLNYNKTGEIKKLKPQKHKNGYLFVNLSGKIVSLHRLVAKTFIPNPENKPQVNHKNGNKMDNRVQNLEWNSSSENILHAYRILGRKSPRLGKKGKDHPNSKIVLQIKDGVVVAEFYGANEASRQTGINNISIGDACRGKNHTAGGYRWEYKKNWEQ